MARDIGKIRKDLLSKKLIDELMNSGGGGGSSVNIAIRKYNKVITTSTNKVHIGTDYFSKTTDTLLVFKNSVYLEEDIDYTFNDSDKTISRANGKAWEATSEVPTTFFFICLMNIPSGDVRIDGNKLLDNTVPESKLTEDVKIKLNKSTEVSSLHGSKIENNSITEEKLSQAVKDKLNRPAGSSVHKYAYNYNISNWSASPNSDEMYTIRVTHNLNNEDLVVTGINRDTNRNVALSHRVIDANNIELESTDKINLRLICYSL